MRSVFIFFLALTVAFYSGCGGSNNEKSSSVTNEEKTVQVNKTDENEERLKKQEEENRNLKEKIEELKKENKKVKEAKEDAERKANERYIILSSIAYTALGIGVLLILTFVFILRQNKKNSVAFTKDDMHCPRCGWEHDPGEKVCKNCGTHF